MTKTRPDIEPHGALTLDLHQQWDNACRKVNRIAYLNKPGLLEAVSERDRAWEKYREAREVELRAALAALRAAEGGEHG